MAETTVDERAHLRRVEVLSDLRVLLNWLEANPGVPVDDYGIEISYCVPGDDADGMRAVKDLAEAVGEEVKTSSATGAHHNVTKRFGSASYCATYIERRYMDDFNRRQKIAREVAAEQSADGS